MSAPRVTVIGGGMITEIQLLPSLYELQRQQLVGEIHVCALDGRTLANLAAAPALTRAFPGQSFLPHPDPSTCDPDAKHPTLYRDILAVRGGDLAVIAVPDALHYDVLRAAVEADQHVCIVKPLVLRHDRAAEIAALARDRGLMIGVEYHKRFDHRALLARQAYRAGRLGQFRLGQAQMIEPYYYRDSNFQNWCTCEHTDMFTYVGCHYVDLVAFITGLRPVSVSVYGIVDEYPNGNRGYLWTDARVIWENGASLSVVDALGYPNRAAGGNAQGLTMWCQGSSDATLLVHSDQYRGVKASYEQAGGEPGDTVYAEPNPDYYQMVDLGGAGLTPVGYGHRSVEAIVTAALRVRAAESLPARQAILDRIDADGILATPANSPYNELVIEAARLSITHDAREAVIEYEPTPRVRLREFA